LKKMKRLLSAVLILSALAVLALPAHAAGLMRYGSRGAEVKQLQGNLIYLGYLDDVADGIFGKKTEAAVIRYQRNNGLAADGIAGPLSNRAIQSEVLRMIDVIEKAKALVGTPYVYGGSTTAGFDCSGFTQYVYRKAGMSIPRVSYEQAKAGKSVPYSKMRPGDLVCFNSPVSHVGIYLGNGMFIHASTGAGYVKTLALKHMDLTAVRRFTGVVPS